MEAHTSIAIGIILTAVAVLLAYESKGLLVGESADTQAVASIRALAEADPPVAWVKPPLTMPLGRTRSCVLSRSSSVDLTRLFNHP